MSIEIKMLHSGDAALLDGIEPGVFERPIRDVSLSEFLLDSRHHMAVALYKPGAEDRQQVVGFASAVHYVHPDKEPELWINEIGVAESHRNHGLGKQLLQLLFSHAHDLGCVEAWVLTDPSNTPAMQLCASIEGVEAVHDQVMFTFKIGHSE